MVASQFRPSLTVVDSSLNNVPLLTLLWGLQPPLFRVMTSSHPKVCGLQNVCRESCIPLYYVGRVARLAVRQSGVPISAGAK